MLNFHCCSGFSLAVASRGCSLVAVLRFLIGVSSFVVEHMLMARGLQQLRRLHSIAAVSGPWSTSSVAAAHGHSCSSACGSSGIRD